MLCQGHLGRLAAAEGLVDAWFPIEASWAASLYTPNPAEKACRAFASFSHILIFSKSEILVSALQKIAGAQIGRISPRPRAEERLHVADHALGRLEEFGWLPPQAVIEPLRPEGLAPGPSTAVGETRGSKTVLIHPGAGSPRKRWPLKAFLELADLAKTRRLNPEFVVGPADRELLAELETHGLPIHCPADCLDLLRLYRSAAAYVGNDSGASHLAAWANLPSVVIFGPSDPARWRPIGRAVEIVQVALECRPCFETEAANCPTENCLAATAPRDVMNALDRLISARLPNASASGVLITCEPN